VTHPSVTKTYYLLGDSSSVGAVMDVLILNCSIQDMKGFIASYGPDSPNRLAKPEQVVRIHAESISLAHPFLQVQLYRARAFARVLDEYNTNAALFQTGLPIDDTALPSIAPIALSLDIDTGSLACLSETTGFAVPLIGMDAHKSSKSETNLDHFLGGIVILFILMLLIVRHYDRYEYSVCTSGNRSTISVSDLLAIRWISM
jgi:hypothetical protein